MGKNGIDDLKPFGDGVDAVVRQAAESSALKCHDGFQQAVASNELTEIIRALEEVSQTDVDQPSLLPWSFTELQVQQAARYLEQLLSLQDDYVKWAINS